MKFYIHLGTFGWLFLEIKIAEGIGGGVDFKLQCTQWKLVVYYILNSVGGEFLINCF